MNRCRRMMTVALLTVSLLAVGRVIVRAGAAEPIDVD